VLLDLSEVLACPVCGPPQIMVAVVHESEGRRVASGFLGCPACDGRFRIDSGVVRLLSATAPSPEPAESDSFSLPSGVEETAVLVGAVLDLAGESGCVLLGPGLAGIAGSLAAIAGRSEVVSFTHAAPHPPVAAPNLSTIVVSGDGPLPVLEGRFRAAALCGEPGEARIRGVAAALRPPGRLAILAPAPGAAHAMRDAGLHVVAADERVAVASKSP
jgi:uncharacterized protein YbaR (Trm112 family)